MDYNWNIFPCSYGRDSFQFIDNQFVQNPVPPAPPSSHDVPLHAPVPLPGYSPLLTRPTAVPNFSHVYCNNLSPYVPAPIPPPTPQQQQSFLTDDFSQFPQHQEMLKFYTKASEQTFPTPSELLSQLTGPPPPCSLPSTPGGAVEPDKKSESQRKARHRAVAQSVGFELTDPDTISSHDKKRHYLECLEAYVVYLHEQLSLVGEPLPLERVSSYRGLSSRSIRTLLVHMENTVRKLHLKASDEEQNFVKLRDSIMVQGAAAPQENLHHRPSPRVDNTSSSYYDIHAA